MKTLLSTIAVAGLVAFATPASATCWYNCGGGDDEVLNGQFNIASPTTAIGAKALGHSADVTLNDVDVTAIGNNVSVYTDKDVEVTNTQMNIFSPTTAVGVVAVHGDVHVDNLDVTAVGNNLNVETEDSSDDLDMAGRQGSYQKNFVSPTTAVGIVAVGHYADVTGVDDVTVAAIGNNVGVTLDDADFEVDSRQKNFFSPTTAVGVVALGADVDFGSHGNLSVQSVGNNLTIKND